MRGAFTTCTAMRRNGVEIGTLFSYRGEPSSIPRVRAAEWSASSEAAHGFNAQQNAVRQRAGALTLFTEPVKDSGWPWQGSLSRPSPIANCRRRLRR